MSLTKIEIRNFQSIRKADLELGLFTVIVGPSSSGKSALIRAFRALASNVRGPGFITRGQSTMAITARTENHTITLERSDRHGKYEIRGNLDHTLVTFTKLAGEVPEQVTQALGIDPVPVSGTNVNFAAQFDKPYLLDESGAVIARQLGELTNVNQVFEAVRAANRIRSAASSKLKTRRDDLEQVKTRLRQFQSLSGHLRALNVIEEANAARRELENRAGRLEKAVKTMQIAQHTLDKYVGLPPVPDATQMNGQVGQYRRLSAQIAALRTAEEHALAAKDRYLIKVMDLGSEKNQLRDMLADAGVCPTCGQATDHPIGD